MRLTKGLIIIIVFTFFSQMLISNGFGYEEYKNFNIDQLQSRQEIIIPIDTGMEISKNQAIDTKIYFLNSCWAIDEKTHSIRIAIDDGDDLIELESQIYNLKKTDDSHISSCNIVFLIPENADGSEKYYVMYDSSETESPNYEDHISTDDTHYFYEPIPGQKIDFDYFEINQDGEVIYAVIQTGELLGNPVAQNVARFKAGSTKVETNNIDQLAGFDIRYGTKETPGYYGTSWATEVEKQILVDGNLMVKFWVKCSSPDKKMQTENIYTYYFSPGNIKRIWVNIHHEIYDTINIENPVVYDGTLCGIVSIKSRSATIDKMNVGDILPEINIYSENGLIETYDVPTNPSSSTKEIILAVEDDADLGENAWMSLHNPDTGKIHGIILDSITGFSEKNDGVSVKTWVEQNIKLPGLEADTANSFLTLNTYEKETGHNTVLSKDTVLDYNAEFINIETDGLDLVNPESEMFQTLVKTRVFSKEYQKDEKTENIQRYSLTTFIHLAPSFPMGSLLSAALGKNIPYVYAELYKENSFKSSGSASRIPMGNVDLDIKDKKIFELAKMIFGLFDYRNITFFKKIVFPDLEPGKYLVKIYKENPLFSENRQYIGFSTVEITDKDESNHVFCGFEGKIDLSISDQKNKCVENTQFLLYVDDVIVSDVYSDLNGTAQLTAPVSLNKNYKLQVVYQGFLVEEKNIDLGLINRFIAIDKSFNFERFDFEIRIVDKWGFTPDIEVNPRLTSNNMVDPVFIPVEKLDEGSYKFSDLFSSEYVLLMRYKSFDVEEKVSIDKDTSLDFVFPAEYIIDLKIMDSVGNIYSDAEVFLYRNGKDVSGKIDSKGTVSFVVPPGEYELRIIKDEEDIARQKIRVRSDKHVDVVTSEGSLFHMFVIVLGVILCVFSIVFLFWKKNFYVGFKLIAVSLIFVSLVLPWWVVSGESNDLSTQTNVYLIPSNIVTVTHFSSVVGGDVSQVPEEVTLVLNVISLMLILGIIFVLISLIIKKRFEKTTILLSFFSALIILISIFIFFYAISQLTAVSVGSFVGGGNIEITVPGFSESDFINCNWGPGFGFYLAIIAVLCLFISLYHKRIELFFSKK